MDTTTSLPSNPDAEEASNTNTVVVVAGEATDGATGNAGIVSTQTQYDGGITTTLPVPAEIAGPLVRGRPFQPGTSGNPAGRPRGARNKATMAAEELLDGEGEALTRKMIEKALAGNGNDVALKFCLERVLSRRRDRPVIFELPAIETVADAAKASAALLQACANGLVSPDEATTFMALLSHLDMVANAELEARVTALEKVRT